MTRLKTAIDPDEELATILEMPCFTTTERLLVRISRQASRSTTAKMTLRLMRSLRNTPSVVASWSASIVTVSISFKRWRDAAALGVRWPDGGRKSTVVDRYVADRIPIINPDNIARTLPADLGEAARVLQAGRIGVGGRSTLLATRQTFGIETTLTGRSELDLMRAAAAAGYQVNLIYIGLRDVQHSMARVSERVRRGGHNVPLPDLIRRFDRSIANLRTAVTIANHRVLLGDNSGRRRRLLYSRKGSRVKFRSPTPPAWTSEVM